LIDDVGDKLQDENVLRDMLREDESQEAKKEQGVILCLPARDEADELVALMLQQRLEQEGYLARTLSARTLSGEIVAAAGKEEVAAVCISALPPFAATHARYLCKRLRPKYPRLPIL